MSTEGQFTDVRAHLDALVADAKVRGLQYLVVDSTDELLEFAHGWADIQGASRMGTTTTLMAYSMSNTIPAAAILQLAESGKLGLDDPVSDYVDSLSHGSRFSILQLLTHIAGVPASTPLRWAHLRCITRASTRMSRWPR